jgi:RNA 2',3'-cyclic 3'-phosphodiesterase
MPCSATAVYTMVRVQARESGRHALAPCWWADVRRVGGGAMGGERRPVGEGRYTDSVPSTPPRCGPGAVKREAPQRVFFAAWPDDSGREPVASVGRVVATQAGGRAPVPANIHLTLAFVGNVAARRLETLREIGATVSRVATPFVLALDRIDGFRDAGIAWIGTSARPPELERLVGHLRDSLAGGGFPVDDRAFRVHVTLARRCTRRVPAAAIAAIIWHVERMTLTASDLGSGGSRYRDLATWGLGQGSP